MVVVKVKLVSYTKDPLKTIAKATLTSYWKEWSIDRLDEITERDAEMHLPKVLSYGHESVLEHVVLTWAVEGISRVTSHQLVRHRLASYTQRSQRFISEEVKAENCDPLELFVIPESIKNAKELSSELVETPYGDEILEVYEDNSLVKEVEKHLRKSYKLYERLLNAGVPPEDARYVLPQAVKTSITITMNFREFKHFIGLRMCERAQWEIRELARKMWEEVYKVEELRPLLKWAKIGPRCISLGYCPERELMPPGCLRRQREWWKRVWDGGE